MNILETLLSVLNTVVLIPKWYLVAIGAGSFVASLLVFLLAGWLLRRGRNSPKAKVSSKRRVVAPPVPVSAEVAKTPVVAFVSVKKRTVPPVVAAKLKPVPPIRQHYWYTVDGSDDRYTTLRDTLQAIGYSLLKGDSPEWRTLSSDLRDKIHREKVATRKASK